MINSIEMFFLFINTYHPHVLYNWSYNKIRCFKDFTAVSIIKCMHTCTDVLTVLLYILHEYVCTTYVRTHVNCACFGRSSTGYGVKLNFTGGVTSL